MTETTTETESASPEVLEKLRRVRQLLDHGVDAVVLRGPGAIAWLSGGGRVHIPMTPQVGVAAVVVRADDVEIVTTVNEAPRLEAEELGGLPARWTVVPWYADLTDSLPTGSRVCTDEPYADVPAAPSLEMFRRALLPVEVARYRALGRETAEVLTDVALSLSPGDSEYVAAARASAGLFERGIDPTVVLVAGGERLAVHRHPLATGGPVGPMAMIVVCGRRQGLIANVTRFVSFGPLPGGTAERYHDLLAVEAAYLDATVVGGSVLAAFRSGTAAYGAHGFDADEWELHHQGGPTGYAAREWFGTPTADAVIEPAQAFAWNPSARGIKVEDTVLASDTGVEILTVDPRWPTQQVAGRERPDLLVRD